MMTTARKKQLVGAISLTVYTMLMLSLIFRFCFDKGNDINDLPYSFYLCFLWLAFCFIIFLLLLMNKGKRFICYLLAAQAALVLASLGQASFVKSTSMISNNACEFLGDLLTAVSLVLLAAKEAGKKLADKVNKKVLSIGPVVLLLTGTAVKIIWIFVCYLKGAFAYSATSLSGYLLSGFCISSFERLFHDFSSESSILLFCTFLVYMSCFSNAD